MLNVLIHVHQIIILMTGLSVEMRTKSVWSYKLGPASRNIKLVNDDIKIMSFRIYSQSQIRQTSNNQTESGTNSILM